ncbi:MAG: hypothetical protein ABWY05_12165 [Noviherbaspirillum sp.]
MMKTLMVAISATLFSGAALAATHSAAPETKPSKEEKSAAKPAGSATKDVKGETEANREGKMSPTGQNETSSASPPKKDAATSTKAK